MNTTTETTLGNVFVVVQPAQAQEANGNKHLFASTVADSPLETAHEEARSDVIATDQTPAVLEIASPVAVTINEYSDEVGYPNHGGNMNIEFVNEVGNPGQGDNPGQTGNPGQGGRPNETGNPNEGGNKDIGFVGQTGRPAETGFDNLVMTANFVD